MPAAGAADSLSLALANRLVGNPLDDVALEITLSGGSFICETEANIAQTGAPCELRINDDQKPHHHSIPVAKGDRIVIGPAQKGCRSYLSIAGGFDVDTVLGSQSTYPPATLGGFKGRALVNGDLLPLKSAGHGGYSEEKTPDQFIPPQIDSVILRVTTGPEFSQLDQYTQTDLFANKWIVAQRMSRIGLMLEGKTLSTSTSQSMPSAAVFPGTIQCPSDGFPFLLGPDAQTTGGYPRIVQVIRADRHLIGQLRPGSKVQLVQITPDRATEIYREKLKLLKPWLGELKLW